MNSVKHRRLFFPIALGMVAAVAGLLDCARQPQAPSVVTVASLQGQAFVTRAGQEAPLSVGAGLGGGDVVRVAPASQLELAVAKVHRLFLRENGYATIRGDDRAVIQVSIAKGEALVVSGDSAPAAISLLAATPQALIEGAPAVYNLTTYAEEGISIVKVLRGEVRLNTVASAQQRLSACRKILIQRDGSVSDPLGLSSTDLNKIRSWAAGALFQNIGEGGECVPAESLSVNAPPVWLDTPATSCAPGRRFVDTLRAADPDKGAVRFRLLAAPAGMSIGELDGVLRYTRPAAGAHEIRVAAEDSLGAVCERSYVLTVMGSLSAVLQAPARALPGQAVSFTATRSVNALGTAQGLTFRIDYTADGKWDEPAGGAYGDAATFTHAYEAEGAYTVRLEVAAADGKTAQTTRTLIVNAPPAARAVVQPSLGTVQTSFAFDAAGSTDGVAGAEGLRVRWDFDNDGRWDVPGDTGFTREKKASHRFDRIGEYTVVLQVQDSLGGIGADTLQVPVFQGISGGAISGPDSGRINQKLAFTCTAADSQSPIVEYAWDFDGNGSFEKSAAQAAVQTAFAKPGLYSVNCRVTNAKGLSLTVSKPVMIVNTAALVEAGGPYSCRVNDSLQLAGSGTDSDSRIVGYYWDFNLDGQPDWQSDSSANATHVFLHGGSYRVVLGVKTDDGAVSRDTAEVTVSNTPPTASAGVDLTSQPGRKVKLSGRGEDAESNIAEYAWDFDGDGVFDWRSAKSGIVEHGFAAYARAILRVMDGDSAMAFDTVTVIVCPRGMTLIEEGKFCIDNYEWPNRKGAEPLRAVSFSQAAAKCDSVGKRLCTGEEWVTACRGSKEKFDFPYGRRFVETACNTLKGKPSASRVASSGDYPDCVSPFGVADMSGNVAEWTSAGSETARSVYGGWWQDSDVRVGCTAYVGVAPGKQYPYLGFRCCK